MSRWRWAAVALTALIAAAGGVLIGRRSGGTPPQTSGPSVAELRATAAAKRAKLTQEAKEVLEPLYISIKKMRSATAQGVNYTHFMELFADAHTQVSIATDRLASPNWPPNLTLVTGAYLLALANYADSADAWKQKIELADGKGGVKDMGYFFEGQSPVLEAIARRHGIEMLGADHPRLLIAARVIERIWAEASKHADQGDDLYLKAIGERTETSSPLEEMHSKTTLRTGS